METLFMFMTVMRACDPGWLSWPG